MGKLTSRQLGLLLFLSLLAPAVRLLPEAAVRFAGRAAWLSPFVAAPVALGYALLAVRLSRRGLPGRFLPIALALWLVLYAGFTARSAAERLNAAILQETPSWLIAALTVLAAMLPAAARREGLGRLGELTAPVIAALLAFCGVCLAPELRPDNLLPVGSSDAPGAALGALPMAELGGLTGYFLLLEGEISDRERLKKSVIRAVLALFATFFLIIALTVGALSPELALQLTNPLFTAVRNIELGGGVARVEALVVSLWITTDMLFIASLLAVSGHLAASSLPKRLPPHLPGLAALIAALVLRPDADALKLLSDLIVPAVNAAVTLVILPLSWLTQCKKSKGPTSNL